MQELLKKFENKTPEIVFEWSDSETEAEGWVVINSLRGGAAGGGTRMRKGLDKREVESLAKTMEVKFTVSGPAIGGAKSGINFDPSDPRKDGVLQRWYKAVMPLLKNYYGTGGDLNVDEIHEVIPITESYGLWHPQEGVVNGHFHANEPQKIRKIGQLRQGVCRLHQRQWRAGNGRALHGQVEQAVLNALNVLNVLNALNVRLLPSFDMNDPLYDNCSVGDLVDESGAGRFFSHIAHDHENPTTTVAEGVMAGEPCFVPDPKGTAEDHGWLLA